MSILQPQNSRERKTNSRIGRGGLAHGLPPKSGLKIRSFQRISEGKRERVKGGTKRPCQKAGHPRSPRAARLGRKNESAGGLIRKGAAAGLPVQKQSTIVNKKGKDRKKQSWWWYRQEKGSQHQERRRRAEANGAAAMDGSIPGLVEHSALWEKKGGQRTRRAPPPKA